MYVSVGHLQSPSTRYVDAALMVADVTGFTAITEKYGKRGAIGIEILTG